MTDFRDLQIWTKAQAIAVSIYTCTKDFPSDEKFGITSQMRRAAVSISSNIAEGCGQGTDPGFVKFLHIAFGSACELESLCYLCKSLSYTTVEQHQQLTTSIVDVKKMLSSFLQKVQSRIS